MKERKNQQGLRSAYQLLGNGRSAAITSITVLAIAFLLVPIGAFRAVLASAEASRQTLGQDQWWPSIWGSGDEAGASNWITNEKVMEAARLIETGDIYELGRPYETGMPLFGQRTYSLVIPGAPTGGPFSGGLVYHDEFVVGEIGQVGTQFDGLGHIGIVHNGSSGSQNDIRFYNGFTATEIAGAYGLQKLGIEKIRPIFTTGILIDVAGYKGGMMEVGEEISMADVRGALNRQRMSLDDVGQGDVVLFNTGWGALWMVDNELYNAGAPGIGMEVARWLADQRITLVGSDTWPVEVVPSADPEETFPAHKYLIARNGILFHENLYLAKLAQDEVYRFAYIFVRVPFKGGTGSPGSPVAVK